MTAIQNSLTAPSDRSKNHVFDFNHNNLTTDEFNAAKDELINKDHLELYPKNEKAFADPSIDGQSYSLISFYPSTGATPDKDGIYGMVKVRGTYGDLDACDKRSEYLIKNIDSVHSIYYAGVGKPFPITCSSKFSKDINKIKIQEKMAEEKMKKETKEEQEIREIKEREAEIMKQNQKPIEISDIDKYITLKVKKAQLIHTYLNMKKKMKEIKSKILDTRDEIEFFDEQNNLLKDTYMEKYNKSLESVNITQQKDSFIRYIEDDATNELGF